MHKNTIDLTGQRFGNLLVLELTDLKLPKKRSAVWKCRCDCGKICYQTSMNLKDKRSKSHSCGCMSLSKRKTFPNVFVPKTPAISKKKREFADDLLEYFKDAPFIDELTEGINMVLNKDEVSDNKGE